MRVHTIPQCVSQDAFREGLESAIKNRGEGYNILVVHAGVKGIEVFSTGEHDELIMPTGYFKEFDYVALGHYHDYTEVEENAYYPGSSEYLSFNEADKEKAIIEIEFKKDGIKYNKIPLSPRSMIDFSIRCDNLTREEIVGKMEEIISSVGIKEKIIRIKLLDIYRHIYNEIDRKSIKEEAEKEFGAFYFKIEHKFKEEEETGGVGAMKIGSLTKEWEEFISKVSTEKMKGMEKKRLKDLGLRYIEDVMEGEEE